MLKKIAAMALLAALVLALNMELSYAQQQPQQPSAQQTPTAQDSQQGWYCPRLGRNVTAEEMASNGPPCGRQGRGPCGRGMGRMGGGGGRGCPWANTNTAQPPAAQ